MKSILVVTSLSPKNVARQLDCVLSWKPLASRVVSLHHHEELPLIQPEARGIELVAVDESAKNLLGKPFIFIDSFFDYFRRSPETHLLIVNSDIFLGNPDRMRQIFESVHVDLLFGQRVDVEALTSTSGELFGGFDYFLLSKEAINMYPRSQFCMGAPWWDHWLPLVPLTTGRASLLCSEPIALHVKHTSNWGIKPLSVLGYHMAEQLSALWTKAGERLAQEGHTGASRDVYRFGQLFVKYFMERRKIYKSYEAPFEQLPQELKGEVSWDMTDVYPVVTLDFIMKFAERFR